LKRIFTCFLIIWVFVSCQVTPSFIAKLEFTELDGQKFDKSLIENKIVILNLWATWCKPCIKEMPDLETMQEKLPDDFTLLVASNEEMDKILSFQQRQQYNLKLIKIENNLESLGIYSLPTTLIINKDGMVVETLVGARNWTSSDQIAKLKTYSR